MESYYAHVALGPIPEPLAQQVRKAISDSQQDEADTSIPLIRWLVDTTDPVDLTETPHGLVAELTDDDAAYGLSQWMSLDGYRDPWREGVSLESLLIDAGIPFIADDTGKYEIEGMYAAWSPGMDHIFTISAHEGESPYLGLSEWRNAVETAGGDAAAIVAAVDRLFGIGVVPEPHPTRAALDAAWEASHRKVSA